jgi:cytochrome bd ubiquinol oxidase subunit II
MALHTVWFIVVAFFWVGFFVLEGFDFGVGMLHTIVGSTEAERRVAVNTIGPFWDGNEVWLVVAGASTFAAFPSWYATMFSALYLAVLIVLVALIGRGVSFEFRGKIATTRWRTTWRRAFTIGSAVVPLLLGVALGDLLNGLPIDKSHNYTGSFWGLLTPFGLWTGVTLLVLSVLSGASFLALKTTGLVRARSVGVTRWASWVALAAVVGFVIWARLLAGGVLPDPFAILTVLAAAGAVWLAGTGADGWSFTAATVAMGGTVATIFIDLYANVMVSSTSHAYNLTVSNASSSSYALKVMTVVAVIFVPLVIGYQAWNYWVFRHRLTSPPRSEDAGGLDPDPGERAGPGPPAADPAGTDAASAGGAPAPPVAPA